MERQPPEMMGGTPRSPKWSALRDHFIRLNPYCKACGGKEHLNAHHIVPYHIDPSRELDPSNLITLCEGTSHNCHLMFGHCLNWSLWNRSVESFAGAVASMMRHAAGKKSVDSPPFGA